MPLQVNSQCRRILDAHRERFSASPVGEYRGSVDRVVARQQRNAGSDGVMAFRAKVRYPSLERIAQVACPLLVIAGDGDSIVPVEQSRQLYDAAPSPKRLVPISGADHNDEALVAGPEIVQSTLRLLQAF